MWAIRPVGLAPVRRTRPQIHRTTPLQNGEESSCRYRYSQRDRSLADDGRLWPFLEEDLFFLALTRAKKNTSIKRRLKPHGAMVLIPRRLASATRRVFV